jgi:hypothetical protein
VPALDLVGRRPTGLGREFVLEIAAPTSTVACEATASSGSTSH